MLNFCAARKNVSAWVRMLNLALCNVQTHNKVHTVCTNIIMVRMVCTHIIMVHMLCAVLAKRRGVWLVCMQCAFMLSRDILINGAREVVVHGGGTKI
jgi:hypothetical protein